jgi:hypothetical protein
VSDCLDDRERDGVLRNEVVRSVACDADEAISGGGVVCCMMNCYRI